MRPDRALVEDLHAEVVGERLGLGAAGVAVDVAAAVRRRQPLASAAEVRDLTDDVLHQVVGLGAIQGLIEQAGITEVMINGPGRPVWVEEEGQLRPTEVVLDERAVNLVVERIAGPLGLRVDRTRPAVDARLPDGSRVNIVVPPLAVDGPCVTIRRFALRTIALHDLCPAGVDRLLADAVAERRNVIAVGGTGAGKTTLLNALAGSLGRAERIITVEDAAELELDHPHVVRLEARAGASIRDLVRNALRMRPDRIVVGEVRGGEALDLLVAMNTGHEGTLSTLHANSCADAVARLETLVVLAGSGLPLEAIQAQLWASVDLLVHVARLADGRRRVVEVAELAQLAPGDRHVRALADSSGPTAAASRPPRLRRVA